MRPILLLSVLLLAFPCLLFAADEAALTSAVTALPEAQPWEQMKKAALQWALEDAKAAREQGFPDRAEVDLKDVETLLNKEIGHARKAPEKLFPPIPPLENYPFDKDIFGLKGPKGLDQILKSDERFPKGEAGNIVRDATGWTGLRRAYEALKCVDALCHPQSPYAGKAQLIAPIFRRFENCYEYLTLGSKRLMDFGDASCLPLMYLEFKSVYPDLILPSRQAQWERALRTNSDAILAAHEATYEAGKVGTAYFNADVKYSAGLVYAGILFPETKYSAVGEAGVKLLASSVYPDGGTPYIYAQNEDFTYHSIAVTELARLWQVTGNLDAGNSVLGMKNYYPLSIEPPGVAEYSTAPSWKHYWHGATASVEAAIVAQVANDPQDERVAEMNRGGPSLLLASLFHQPIKPAPLPDNYFVYDRNIQGPRARFGAFSISATARNYLSDPRGKSGYVGCIVTYPLGAKHDDRSPMSGTLDLAGTEILIKPGSTVGHGAVLNLAQPERNASLVSPDVAAISTTHQLSPYGGKPQPWRQSEAWLFTPHRLVGLVQVESLADQSAYGINGVLQYLHGWGNKDHQDFQVQGDRSFQYGLLITTIREHDYAKIGTSVLADANEPGKYSRIVLADEVAGSNQKASYAKGAHHFFLAEIYPKWNQPADQVQSLKLNDGLMGFQVTEQKMVYRMVFNPGETDQNGLIAVTAGEVGFQLHHSGEAYRPAWIEADGQEKSSGSPPTTVSPTNGEISVTLPAGGHVVLVSHLN